MGQTDGGRSSGHPHPPPEGCRIRRSLRCQQKRGLRDLERQELEACRPYLWATSAVRSSSRFIEGASGGRVSSPTAVSAGKTVACVADLVDAALRCPRPNGRFAYVAPLFVQAKDVAWNYLKQFVAPIPGVTTNESELSANLPNGARIR